MYLCLSGEINVHIRISDVKIQPLRLETLKITTPRLKIEPVLGPELSSGQNV